MGGGGGGGGGGGAGVGAGAGCDAAAADAAAARRALCVAVAGPSGCGKSVMAQAVAAMWHELAVHRQQRQQEREGSNGGADAPNAVVRVLHLDHYFLVDRAHAFVHPAEVDAATPSPPSPPPSWLNIEHPGAIDYARLERDIRAHQQRCVHASSPSPTTLLPSLLLVEGFLVLNAPATLLSLFDGVVYIWADVHTCAARRLHRSLRMGRTYASPHTFDRFFHDLVQPSYVCYNQHILHQLRARAPLSPHDRTPAPAPSLRSRLWLPHDTLFPTVLEHHPPLRSPPPPPPPSPTSNSSSSSAPSHEEPRCTHVLAHDTRPASTTCACPACHAYTDDTFRTSAADGNGALVKRVPFEGHRFADALFLSSDAHWTSTIASVLEYLGDLLPSHRERQIVRDRASLLPRTGDSDERTFTPDERGYLESLLRTATSSSSSSSLTNAATASGGASPFSTLSHLELVTQLCQSARRSTRPSTSIAATASSSSANSNSNSIDDSTRANGPAHAALYR